MKLRKRGNAADEGESAAKSPAPVVVKKRGAKTENGKAAKSRAMAKKEEQENVEPETQSEYFKDTAKDGLSKEPPGNRAVEYLDDDSDEEEEVQAIEMKNSKKKSPFKGKAFQKKEAKSGQKAAKKRPPAEATGPILSVEDAIENMLKMEMMGAKSSKDTDDDAAMMSGEDEDESGQSSEEDVKKVGKRRDDNDDDDFQEVEMVDHASLVPKITKESLQITVESKKSKKQVDKAAQLERMRKAILKKYRIIVHKLHLHCWLAHGFYLNRLCLSDMVRAVVLSVEALQFSADFKLANLDRKLLVRVLETARTAFGLDAKSKFESQAVVSNQSLMKTVGHLRCDSYLEYLLVVLVILRNMSVKARICVCFDVTSLKEETSSRAKTSGGSKKASRAKKQECEELTSSEEEDEPKPAVSKKTATKTKMSRKSSKAAREKLKKQEASDSEEQVDSDERDFKDIKKRVSKTAAGKRVKKVEDEDDEDFKPEIKASLSDDEPQAKPKGKVKDEAMDLEHDPNNNVIDVKHLNKPVTKDNKILSTDEDTSINLPRTRSNRDRCYWLEVYLESDQRWVCVEPVSLVVDDPDYFEKRFDDQVLYVCAFDENNRLKDVTKRYSSNFLTTGRLLHISHIDDKKLWWETILFKYLPLDAELDMQEEKELKQMLLGRGLPSGLSDFKGHPLYILKRHLLKFQSICPKHPTPVGHFREDPVYSRDSLVTLHSRQTWLKFARVIKPGQDAYKIVKGRLKASEYKAGRRDNPDLELFGFWQTKEYEPPRAFGGKVPRNEFGNVELFLPNMLPRGCVHLHFANLNRVCRKLNIDCAAAVVGFDAHGGFSHAVYDGWVVCEEFKETVIAAAQEEERRANLKLVQMREEKILKNWQRLVRGVQIREKLRLKYETFNSKGQEPPTKASKPQPDFKAEREVEYPLENFKSKKPVETPADDDDKDLCDSVQISAKLAKSRAKSKPASKKLQASVSKKPAKKQLDVDTERHYPKRRTRNKKPILDENDDEEMEVENDDDRDKNFSGSEVDESEDEEVEDVEEEEDEDFGAKSSKKRRSKSKQTAPKRRKKLVLAVPDDYESAKGQAPSKGPIDDDLNLSEEDD